MLLRARQFQFSFPRQTLVMGILNVTPDSFSDGGRHRDVSSAVARAQNLVAQGADILDIGGESSRPGAASVSEEEELRRVIPVIEQLHGQTKVPISIDTSKAAVARAALEAGASIVNDVAAARQDENMWNLVAQTGAGYIVMHSKGSPATMQENPQYADVVSEVVEFFAERLQTLKRCGVSQDQVILDPGIGFGKTPSHNLQLLAASRRFVGIGRPVMVGASRKSFIGTVTGASLTERLPGSLACACMAVAEGVQIIRAHEVAETVQAIRMTEAILQSAENSRSV